MAVFVLSLAIALGVSFLCSVMEATLLSLTPAQVADLSARRPTIGATWQNFKTHIDRPIAVILAINTAAHTIGASVAGSKFNDLWGDKWIWLFSLLFTFAMLQFTEILPKTLGVRFNQRLAVVMARPLSATIAVFMPVLRLIQLMNRPFAGKQAGGGAATIDEIAALAGLARLTNQIGTHQERIIKAAGRLSRSRARQIMIPIEQVSFLAAEQRLAEAVIAAHVDAHTRFPVCEEGDRNRVVGYVNFKEMIYYMRMNPNEPSFRGIIRPIHFVGPDDTAADLMRTFVDQHIHIAMVRDATGRSLGLITLEDIVEELVGELEDEFDRLPRMFHALPGGTWMVGGGMMMAELVQRLGVTLPAEPAPAAGVPSGAEAAGAPGGAEPGRVAAEPPRAGEAAPAGVGAVRPGEPAPAVALRGAQGSVAAWLATKLQATLGPTRMPAPGDVVHEAGLEFTVRRVRRGKIFEAAVSRARQS